MGRLSVFLGLAGLLAVDSLLRAEGVPALPSDKGACIAACEARDQRCEAGRATAGTRVLTSCTYENEPCYASCAKKKADQERDPH